MNYTQWGAEYLREAEELKRKADGLRAQLACLSGEDAVLLARRIAMLYEMYLECLHTGRVLTERGGANEA